LNKAPNERKGGKEGTKRERGLTQVQAIKANLKVGHYGI